MAVVAPFVTDHEKTQLNRVCFFISLVYSLLSKDLTIQNLFNQLIFVAIKKT